MRFDEVIFSGVSLSEFSVKAPEETSKSVDLYRNCVMMNTINYYSCQPVTLTFCVCVCLLSLVGQVRFVRPCVLMLPGH